MSYIQRIATPVDKCAIALLWKAFIEVRSPLSHFGTKCKPLIADKF
ncbi:hypothetical protein [Nostoc sp. TCL26-01]|nr:hypothetical protein [Nostoc sp. TCL26-01]